MANLIQIENDVFDISNRLKEVDKSYQIFYNLSSKCFEVHSTEQKKGTYCFKVPYPELDDRTVDFALKTRRENIEKIMEEIERDNRLLEEKKLKEQVNLLREIVC